MSCFSQSTYSYGKTSLRVSNSNSSSDSVENLELRFLICLCLETTPISRGLRNLNESMNHNFMHFRESALSAVSLTYLVNEIFFLFFFCSIDNTSTCPSYAISLIIKCVS